MAPAKPGSQGVSHPHFLIAALAALFAFLAVWGAPCPPWWGSACPFPPELCLGPWGDRRAEFWLLWGTTRITAGSQVLGPPAPPAWSIPSYLWLLVAPCPAGIVGSWNCLGWKGPGMSLPRPGSMERAPTTNQRMDPWPSMELCPRSRGVGEPEGLGDPCLLPDPEGRGV